MKSLVYAKAHHPGKLIAELIAAVPALTTGDGLAPQNFTVESDGTALLVRVPDSVSAATVTAVVTAHDATPPVWPPSDSDAVLWPTGDPDASLVFDAASVDRVTAARIRRLYGGADGEARHHRLMAKHAWARDNAAWLHGRKVTLLEKLQAQHYLTEQHVRDERIDNLEAEGHSLKLTKGWR